MSLRRAAVSGMFYPSECEELQHYINHFTKSMPKLTCKALPKALIVPHAGYIYSGFTANLAYHLCAHKRSDIARIVVIGPSHRVYLEGASIALFDAFETPCDAVGIDLEYSQQLKNRYDFIHFVPEAHHEHSTEVQMPFIQHYFPHTKVVELVYGKMDAITLSSLIDELVQEEQTLVVISTDLSHFYAQEEAVVLDNHCIKAIKELDLKGFKGCEACGLVGIKALVASARKHKLQPLFLDYRTSFERSRDASNVVGYTSFIFE